jgi:site-specific recombinase XerD
LNDDLGRHLHGFFETYLRKQRTLSPHTIKSYRDTFKFFIEYLALRRRSSSLSVRDLDPKTVLAFLQHLEDPKQGRSNSASTRNQRLAAIQCFFRYIALLAPRLERQAGRIRAIPMKRVHPQPAESLDREELNVLLSQPSTATPDGVRDLAILTFMYNTGARAQEAADARLSWFDFPGRTVTILGKGGRRRTTPLWPATVRMLLHYQTHYRRQPRQDGDRFFVNQRSGAFTRFGIWAIAKRHMQGAAKTCPSLARRGLSTHSLRHTTAVHLLEAGVEPNVIKSWLGHASISSTSRYLDTNLSHKRRVLEQFGPPSYVVSSNEPAAQGSTRQLLGWLEDL